MILKPGQYVLHKRTRTKTFCVVQVQDNNNLKVVWDEDIGVYHKATNTFSMSYFISNRSGFEIVKVYDEIPKEFMI